MHRGNPLKAGLTEALVLLLLASGCATTSSATGREESVPWEDDLRERAAFEMSCSPSALIVTQLGGSMRAQTSAGVTGCGQKMVYLLVRGSWIANSHSRPAEGVVREERPIPPAASPQRTPEEPGRKPLSAGAPPADKPAGQRCSTAEIIRMHESGMSDSAIDSACNGR
jgi:hypothetical protein